MLHPVGILSLLRPVPQFGRYQANPADVQAIQKTLNTHHGDRWYVPWQLPKWLKRVATTPKGIEYDIPFVPLPHLAFPHDPAAAMPAITRHHLWVISDTHLVSASPWIHRDAEKNSNKRFLKQIDTIIQRHKPQKGIATTLHIEGDFLGIIESHFQKTALHKLPNPSDFISIKHYHDEMDRQEKLVNQIVQEIIHYNQPVFDKLNAFLEKPNTRLVINVGNHDRYLHVYESAKKQIARALGQDYSETNPKLKFYSGDAVYYEDAQLLAFHGDQAGNVNHKRDINRFEWGDLISTEYTSKWLVNTAELMKANFYPPEIVDEVLDSVHQYEMIRPAHLVPYWITAILRHYQDRRQDDLGQPYFYYSSTHPKEIPIEPQPETRKSIPEILSDAMEHTIRESDIGGHFGKMLEKHPIWKPFYQLLHHTGVTNQLDHVFILFLKWQNLHAGWLKRKGVEQGVRKDHTNIKQELHFLRLAQYLMTRAENARPVERGHGGHTHLSQLPNGDLQINSPAAACRMDYYNTACPAKQIKLNPASISNRDFQLPNSREVGGINLYQIHYQLNPDGKPTHSQVRVQSYFENHGDTPTPIYPSTARS